MGEFTGRQLGALSATALAAPLVAVCAATSWIWVLATLAAAALYYIYIGWAAGKTPRHLDYGRLLASAWGSGGGKVLLGLYWVWLVLLAARAGRLSAEVFPMGKGFPVIPVAVALLSGWIAGKGAAVVCRFGSLLCFFVLPLLAGVLCFGSTELELRNLRPTGSWQTALAPLAVLLLPVMGLFLREKTEGGGAARWAVPVAVLAAACSVVTVGVLGPALAAGEAQPFLYMTQSISILGIMERFESVVSSLLLAGLASLAAYFYAVCGKISAGLRGQAPGWLGRWLPPAASVALLWVTPVVPDWVWLGGSGLFWVLLPAVTLGIVGSAPGGKKIAEN